MRFVYAGLLAGCLIVTAPLELFLRARVYVQWRRLALTLLPVVLLFGGWDIAEVQTGAWRYPPGRILGLVLPGGLPIEEAAFFLVIPTCTILTFEAVRAVRGRGSRDRPR